MQVRTWHLRSTKVPRAYFDPVLKLGWSCVISDLCVSEFGDSAESGEVRGIGVSNGSGEKVLKWPSVTGVGVNMCDTVRWGGSCGAPGGLFRLMSNTSASHGFEWGTGNGPEGLFSLESALFFEMETRSFAEDEWGGGSE